VGRGGRSAPAATGRCAARARGWLLVVAGSECRNVSRTRRLRQLVERLPEPEPGQDHAAEVARRVDDERRMIVCSRIAMGERSRLAIREHTSSAVRRAVDKLPRHERETLELVT
jgi:RNA polymerase sigma-70 factor (ECF subfamily)